jgi:hypothetical protein
MRRILMILSVALVTAALMVVLAMPAFASHGTKGGCGTSPEPGCKAFGKSHKPIPTEP